VHSSAARHLNGRAELKPPRPGRWRRIDARENAEKKPEGIALDYAGVRCGRETAGPGSVGAREAVREKRIGSTLAITGTQAEARWAERGA
jgi:hypothetical protein